MTQKFVVTGTDTNIGKTVFAAGLTHALSARYWKPVQAGTSPCTDSETVMRLGQIPSMRIIPEAYRLPLPASPHYAAEQAGIKIDTQLLDIPPGAGPLVIEGAGGIMVPITRTTLFVDIMARWELPVIICARTALGTINHSLMTIETLHRHGVPIHGIAFIGDAVPDSEEIIITLSGARRLGRLPHIDPLTPDTLAAHFATAFDMKDFGG